MKVGVITHWWTKNNYGQVLQAYALQIVLKKMNCDPFLIRYDPRVDINKDLCIKQFKKNKMNFRVRLDNSVGFFDKRGFMFFKKHRLNMTKIFYKQSELKENIPKADIYITGSDQVWGPWFDLEPFFLDFVPDESKKISYAASFGRESISVDEKRRIKYLINRLDDVSVRETSAVSLCDELNVKKIKLVPDPTMLLDKEEWSELLKCSEKNSVKKRRVFFYKVGDLDDDLFEAFISHYGDNDYYYTSLSKVKHENVRPKIHEWMTILSSSGLVVTNSYHGTVFSLIYNKPFISIGRKSQKLHNMNTRLISLLDTFRLRERFIDDFDKEKIDSILIKKINWDKVNKIIRDNKVKGYNYLSKNINSKKKI